MGSKGGNSSQSSNSGFSSSTSTYTPNPEAMAAYRRALSMAENVTSQPFRPYQGQMIAGFTPDQMNAMQGVRDIQGIANPYINASGLLQQQAINYSDPRNFNQAALNQYMNPYQRDVVNATMNNLTQQQQEAMQGYQSKAALNGTFNGSGAYQGRAEIARQMGLANAQTLAGLNSSNYQQAMNQYNQQQQQAIQTAQNASYGLGQIGQQAQNSALTGLQALLSSGQQQQGLGQQQLSAAYQQWQAAQAFPYQQAAFYTGIAGGIAPNMGGTTNTSGFNIGNSQTQQSSPGGGVAGALSMLGSLLPAMFPSDRRDKTDIKYLGEDESGEKLYAYRYKDDPKSYPKVVGPMAQDIEEYAPEDVREVGGHKIVAGLGHLPAEQRSHRAAGGAGGTGVTGTATGADGAATSSMGMNQAGTSTANGAVYSPGQGLGALPSNPTAMDNFLSGVFDPRTADNMARSKWVNQDQGVGGENFAGEGFSLPPGVMGNGAGFQDLTQPGAPMSRGGRTGYDDGGSAATPGFFERWKNNPASQGLYKAGLGMIDSQNSNTLGAINEGAAAGAQAYAEAREAARRNAMNMSRVGRAGGGGMPGFGDLMRQSPYGSALGPEGGAGFIPKPADFGVTPAQDHAKEITGKAAHQAIESAQNAAESAQKASSHGGGGGGGGGGSPKMPSMKKEKAAASSSESGSSGLGQLGEETAAPDNAGQSPVPEAASPVPETTPVTGTEIADAMPGITPEGLVPTHLPLGLGLGFAKGGRLHRASGGAGGSAPGGAGPGVGTGLTLGEAVLGDAESPSAAAGLGKFTGQGENLTGEALLGKWNAERHALHNPGPQLTPKQQGMPDMPDADFYMKPRVDLPSQLMTENYGKQNPGLDTNLMAMAGAGRPGNLGQLAFMTALTSQGRDDAARGEQAQLASKRAAMLKDPANYPVQGYYQSLGSNEVNPDTGLFNINYTGAYRGYPYKDGGRVAKAGGGSFSPLAGQAMKFFLSRGYSPAAAAGIVGNLMHESGGHLNPGAHGDVMNGAYTSFGLAQWRKDRFDNLRNFASKMGTDWKDFNTQLAFVDAELRSPRYRNTFNRIMNARTPSEAAGHMVVGYENPRHRVTGDPSTYLGYNSRVNYANRLAQMYPNGQTEQPERAGRPVSQTSLAFKHDMPAFPHPSQQPTFTPGVAPTAPATRQASPKEFAEYWNSHPNAQQFSVPGGGAPVVAGDRMGRDPVTNQMVPVSSSGAMASSAAPVAKPRRGLRASDFNFVQQAHAEPAPPRGPAPIQNWNYDPKYDYGPGIRRYKTNETDFANLRGDREILGDTPDRVLMGDTPLGAYGDVQSPGGPTRKMGVWPEEQPAQPASTPPQPQPVVASDRPHKYWGDWRDAEHSDFGDFIDEQIAGDRRTSDRPGKITTPMGKYAGPEGGLGQIFDMEGSLPFGASSKDSNEGFGGLFGIFE